MLYKYIIFWLYFNLTWENLVFIGFYYNFNGSIMKDKSKEHLIGNTEYISLGVFKKQIGKIYEKSVGKIFSRFVFDDASYDTLKEYSKR